MADLILDFLDDENYYYGTTPKQAVAEQNQTYFAYFNTLADTSPILQDHTAYYVKYLIDTEGNPVNPEPDANPNRPQAIGLYNLLNDFEVGKNAVIKTITNDPLYDIPPNSYMLNGSYPIVHVGRLTPIATTTTGSGFEDYSRSMLFADLLGNPLSFSVPNLASGFINNGAYSNFGAFPNTDITLPITVNNTPNPYFGYVDSTSIRFIYPGGTSAAGTRIKFWASVDANWTSGLITTRLSIRVNDSQVAYLDEIFAEEWNGDMNSGTLTFETPYLSVPENAIIRIRAIRLSSQFSGDVQLRGYLRSYQETPTGTIQLQNGITGTTASYWTVDTSNYESPPSSGLSVLTASQYLTQLYNVQNIIQITPTASLEIGFPIISTPFNPILPGDKIKFTLNETDVHTIMDVNVGENLGNAALFLTLTPPIDGNTSLNNFTLYRIVNDGTSVILEVKKDISGSAYAGVVQPQFISKELVDNYDKIITDLTQKSIIA